MKKGNILLLSLAILLLTGCEHTDVVGRYAAESLTELEEKGFLIQSGGTMTIAADEGKATLHIGQETIRMSFAAEPFLQAGLDRSNLPQGILLVDDNTLAVEAESVGFYGSDFAMTAREFIFQNRDRLSFHHSMGHFSLSLGNKNGFEWAQRPESNDEDLVFVLDPQPFIEAGVDVERIAGWDCKDVQQMDGAKKYSEKKLLLSFDIIMEEN